jgi:hypothetical protein
MVNKAVLSNPFEMWNFAALNSSLSVLYLDHDSIQNKRTYKP